MRRWMQSLLGERERELPLAKRDLLVHAHVDLLPTRWHASDRTDADDHADPDGHRAASDFDDVASCDEPNRAS